MDVSGPAVYRWMRETRSLIAGRSATSVG